MRLRPIFSGGHGYAVVHWNTPTSTPRARTRATAASISSIGLMPVDSSTGLPVSRMRSSSIVFDVSPDAIFQSGMPMRSSSSMACTENGDDRNRMPRSRA